MSFDLEKFDKAQFKSRTDTVPVPELQAFFAKDTKPEDMVFKIRNLEATEVTAANDSFEKARKLEKFLEQVASPDQNEQVKGLVQAMGFEKGTTPDLAKRFDLFHFGCVEPKFTRTQAVRFAKHFPGQFYVITNAVWRLTGLGSDPGKLPGSGETQESAAP